MCGVFVSLGVTGDSHNGQRVNVRRCNFADGKRFKIHKLPGGMLRNNLERDVASLAYTYVCYIFFT